MYTFDDLVGIIAKLRSPEGCPWDREQTFESLKKCLADETEEVFQAIDNKDMENLCEELGDVLLQVILDGIQASPGLCRQLFVEQFLQNSVVQKLSRPDEIAVGTLLLENDSIQHRVQYFRRKTITDIRTVCSADLQNPIGHQNPNGLPNRIAPHAERFHQIGLGGDLHSRLELSAHNSAGQP